MLDPAVLIHAADLQMARHRAAVPANAHVQTNE
jgi:hypothetical protein